MLAALAAVFLLPFTDASGQQALRPGSIPSPATPAFNVNANGMTLAQHVPAIETSRLQRDSSAPLPFGVDANGNALPDAEPSGTDGDDSLGAQQILKAQERVRTVTLSGSVAAVGTSNVALASADERSDMFLVVSAGAEWTPRLSQAVVASIGAGASLFRYDRTPELDFQNLNLHAGLAWSPAGLRGVTLFARYDFAHLLDADGRKVLTDHTLTVGAQKGIALGRNHGLMFGITAAAGFSDPSSAQRDQLGAFVSYRLLVTRRLETEVLLRPALHLHDDFSRTDFNQILSWNLRYRFTDWAELNAYFSYGLNRSEETVFDYNVLTGGGGAAVVLRF